MHFIRLSSALLLWTLAPKALAAMNTLNVSGWGIQQTVGGALQSIASVLAVSIIPLCIAIFTVGALLYTASLGDEGRKSTGKTMMVGAVIGVAIVVAARGILGLTYYFFTGF